MKRYILFLFLVLSIFCFSSCQKNPTLSIKGDSSIKFTEEGGTSVLSFSCNRDWFISSSCSWCSISPSSGESSEDGTIITITCEPNLTYDDRSCELTINCQGITKSVIIEQDAAKGLYLSQSLFEIPNSPQTFDVTVLSNVEYTVTIDPDCEKWITRVISKSLTSDILTFNVFENQGYEERVGHIIIAQNNGSLKEVITVRQEQKDGLFLNTQEYVVTEVAQSLMIEVSSNVDYEILPDVEWIKSIETKALNSTTAVLSIEANESTFSRFGKVYFKEACGSLCQVVSITQQAKPDLKTERADNISLFGASLNGSLVVESAAESVEDVWFLYSSNVSSIDELKTSGTKVFSSLTDSGRFSKELSGLSVATRYFYVACAKVNGREYYGEMKSFDTLDYFATINTGKATDIGFFACQLHGTLSFMNAEGLSKEVWFLFSPSCTTLEELNKEGIMVLSTLSDDGQFHASLTELNYATQYYYVACAKIHDRIFYGDVKSFTTSSFYANVTTLEASSDLLYMATLRGGVALENAASFTKSAGFLYGEGDNMSTLENLKESGVSVDAGINLDYNFSIDLKGLKCNTLYYYVAWVKVYDRVFYGEVISFLTYALPDGAVDMGLSVAWASCNIDALAPEEIGGLYAWAETETKSEYSWGNYKWGSPNHFIKYPTDNYVVIEPEDDVAHVKLGGRWRIPTKEEYEELINNCTWCWLEYKGSLGYTVTSRVTGNMIFFPVSNQNSGEYWTSSHKLRELSTVLYINEMRKTVDFGSQRYLGLPVRAVTN